MVSITLKARTPVFNEDMYCSICTENMIKVFTITFLLMSLYFEFLYKQIFLYFYKPSHVSIFIRPLFFYFKTTGHVSGKLNRDNFRLWDKLNHHEVID